MTGCAPHLKPMPSVAAAGAEEDGDSDDMEADLEDDDLARLDSSASSADYWQALLKEHWLRLQRVRSRAHHRGFTVPYTLFAILERRRNCRMLYFRSAAAS